MQHHDYRGARAHPTITITNPTTMYEKLIFIDTETTGVDEKARLIQCCYSAPEEGCEPSFNTELFKNPDDVPIDYGAMAVSHITPEMVADKPYFFGSPYETELSRLLQERIMVAHNATFDKRIIEKDGVMVKYSPICTKTLAQHLLPEQEKHNLQYLRYALGIYKHDGVSSESALAHDAEGDVRVMIELFKVLHDKLIEKHPELKDDWKAALKKMCELSITPVLIKKFTFGKFKGMKVGDAWENERRKADNWFTYILGEEMKKKEAERNRDLVYTLNHYIHTVK